MQAVAGGRRRKEKVHRESFFSPSLRYPVITHTHTHTHTEAYVNSHVGSERQIEILVVEAGQRSHEKGKNEERVAATSSNFMVITSKHDFEVMTSCFRIYFRTVMDL